MKKLILTVSIILAMMLSACSNSNSTSAPKAGDNTAADSKTEVIAGAKLRFAIWDEFQKPAMDAIISKFNETYPQIEVQLELIAPLDQYLLKLETSATGRSAPDIFWTTAAYFDKYAKNGILEPLDEWMARDQFDLSLIYENLVEMYTYDDKVYGIPKDYDTVGLWYNKKIFDDAGVPYPDDTWDWAKLVEASKKLTDPSKGIWGYAAAVSDRASYYNSIPQNGGQIITEDGKSGYDSPEAIEAVKYWTDFIHVHKVSPTLEQMTDTTPINMFKTGNVAMYVDGSWRASEFAGDPYTSVNADVAVVPQGKVRASSGNALAYSMYSESKNKEQAWELMKFLGSREAADIQAKFGAVIPSHKGAEQAWVDAVPQFNLQVFVDMASYVQPAPASVETAKWRSNTTKQFQRAWAGEISVEEAAKLAADEMNTILMGEK